MKRILLAIACVALHVPEALAVELDVITPPVMQSIAIGETIQIPILVRVNTPEVDITAMEFSRISTGDADSIAVDVEVHNPITTVTSPVGDLDVRRWENTNVGTDYLGTDFYQGFSITCENADICTGVGELGRLVDPGYDPSTDTFDFAWLWLEGRKRGRVDFFLTIGKNGIVGKDDNGAIDSQDINVFFNGEGPFNADADRLVTTSEPQFRVWVVPEPSAFALAAIGLLGLFGCARRKRVVGF
ncbi:MAG: PEP-CTERM sorting domain-containing protein [Pirellulaceae bacterium]